ncbi:IS66 family transposase [Thorsellia kenyensis]|uniref:Transposase n=1 Tax=Thorsellia kenyensis TaxID=1549888 RepID=A0ABV6C9C7_9GAMM
MINPDLPREERIIDLEDKTCKTCSSEMTAIGEAISEKVDFILAKIIVIRTKRIKYTCTCCQTLVATPMPAEIIDKGIPTDNLLAEIVAKKFIYHLPLYRQRQLFKTMGVDFSLSTLSDWVAAVGNALSPLAESPIN